MSAVVRKAVKTWLLKSGAGFVRRMRSPASAFKHKRWLRFKIRFPFSALCGVCFGADSVAKVFCITEAALERLPALCLDKTMMTRRSSEQLKPVLLSDDDGLGRGAHKANVSAQIEAGLLRFKTRKDHWRLAVRTERTLARRFAMEKRGDGAI
jgi:hypothetical protein